MSLKANRTGRYSPRRDRRPRRRGIVLIAVVTLVLLLAIIGVGFLSTTGNDRFSAERNMENTQIEMYLDSAVAVAVGSIVNDLYSERGLRVIYGTTDRAETLDSTNNRWLCERAPLSRTGTTLPFAKYWWRSMGSPPHLASTNSSGTGASRFAYYFSMTDPKVQQSGGYGCATFLQQNGEDYPALQYGTSATNAKTLIAADTDGDGVADAGLFELFRSPRDGVHYFSAIRTVDHNSVINANTAWSSTTDPGGTARPDLRAAWPSGVGLQEILPSATRVRDMTGINSYRLNGASLQPYTTDPTNGTVGVRNDLALHSMGEALWLGLGRRMGSPAPSANNRYFQRFPVSDSAALAYRFLLVNPDADPSVLEEQTLQATGTADNSGNRAALPVDGVYRSAPNFVTGFKEYGLPRKSGVRDPKEYFPVLDAWLENFNYDGGNYNVRPLLTTHNPVSNAIWHSRVNLDGDGENDPGHPLMMPYLSEGKYDPAKQYKLGQLVQFDPDGTGPLPERSYVCIERTSQGISPPAPGAPDTEYGYVYWWQGNRNWEAVAWTATPLKVSMNTAGFREAFRGFWNALNADSSSGTAGVGGSETLRYINGPVLSGYQNSITRAAQMAVNFLDIRDADEDVSSRTITLYGDPRKNRDVRDVPQFQLTVFGNERQPFITEVTLYHENPNALIGDFQNPGDPFLEILPKRAPKKYVAIEIYNPYDRAIPLKNWRLAWAKRPQPRAGAEQRTVPKTDPPEYVYIPPASTPADQQHKLEELLDLSQFNQIPPRSFIVFESDPNQRPTNAGTPQGTVKTVPELAEIIPAGATRTADVEVYVLRPRRADGTLTKGIRPDNTYDEGTGNSPNLSELIPADQFDFSSIPLPSKAGEYKDKEAPDPKEIVKRGDKDLLHTYERPASSALPFQCVYPGKYTFKGKNTAPNPGETNPPAALRDGPFHERFMRRLGNWTDPKPDPDPAALPDEAFVPGSLGVESTSNSFDKKESTLPCPLNRPEWSMDNRLTNGVARYPFGYFKYDGEILRVPYVGAVRFRNVDGSGNVSQPADTFMELNSPPMDSAFARRTGNAGEFLGRICPKDHSDASTFRGRLADYFTVLAPHDDFLPNVGPGVYVIPMPDGSLLPLNEPDAVASGAGLLPNVGEDRIGVQGLVNINTAPWFVLSKLPLVTDAAGNVDQALTLQVARRWGQVDGSIIYVARNYYPTVLQAYMQAYVVNQAIAPAVSSSANLENWDFERQFFHYMRLSNILTVRSDCFTVYIVVEGWRDAYTPNARRVLQRRVALLVDRSVVTPDNPRPRVMEIPNN